MSYIFIYVDHNWHFYVCKLMISVGNLSIFSDFLTHFWPKCSTAVSMPTAMQTDERIVDYVIFRKLFVRVIDINLRGGGAPE